MDPHLQQLHIPQIGECIELGSNWSFDLYFEARNLSFLELMQAHQHVTTAVGQAVSADIYAQHYNWGNTSYKGKALKLYGIPVKLERMTIPAGAKLSVDRIYIRKGQGEFDSITFNLLKGSANHVIYEDGIVQPVSFRGKVRFWVKLKDANTIVISGITPKRK